MRKRINEDQNSKEKVRNNENRRLSTAVDDIWILEDSSKNHRSYIRNGRYEEVYKMTYFPSTRLHFFPDKR